MLLRQPPLWYVPMQHPVLSRVEDNQRDLVDPAVKGTTTVIQSAIKSRDSVKRIVLTSSVAGA